MQTGCAQSCDEASVLEETGFGAAHIASSMSGRAAAAEVAYDPARFQVLRFRHIGPFRGGRSTAVAGIPGQLFTFDIGSTGGGVFKSTDSGTSWSNVSDGYFAAGSIGAIAIAASDPDYAAFWHVERKPWTITTYG